LTKHQPTRVHKKSSNTSQFQTQNIKSTIHGLILQNPQPIEPEPPSQIGDETTPQHHHYPITPHTGSSEKPKSSPKNQPPHGFTQHQSRTASPKKINPQHREFKTHTILKLTFQNHEREKREKPRGRRERSRERERGEKQRKRKPLPRLVAVAAPAVHGSGEKLEGPAMEALVRSWRERLGGFHERGRKKREGEREKREAAGGKKRKKEMGRVNPTRSFK
jgi:hypothetical protein